MKQLGIMVSILLLTFLINAWANAESPVLEKNVPGRNQSLGLKI